MMQLRRGLAGTWQALPNVVARRARCATTPSSHRAPASAVRCAAIRWLGSRAGQRRSTAAAAAAAEEQDEGDEEPDGLDGAQHYDELGRLVQPVRIVGSSGWPPLHAMVAERPARRRRYAVLVDAENANPKHLGYVVAEIEARWGDAHVRRCARHRPDVRCGVSPLLLRRCRCGVLSPGPLAPPGPSVSLPVTRCLTPTLRRRT
jgi:hypothetical protein